MQLYNKRPIFLFLLIVASYSQVARSYAPDPYPSYPDTATTEETPSGEIPKKDGKITPVPQNPDNGQTSDSQTIVDKEDPSKTENPKKEKNK